MIDISRCKIDWNVIRPSNWAEYFQRVSNSNLLQCHGYARVMCNLNHQIVRWGLIYIDEKEAGLVQVLEAGLFKNVLHALIVDRGPLWFEDFGSLCHFEAFARALNAEFPKKIGRRRRFIPEIEDSAEARIVLERSGFKKSSDKTYETIMLDLQKRPEELKAHFKKKWRNTLTKAQKGAVKLEWDDKGQYLASFLQRYQKDKALKNYSGPSLRVMKALGENFAKNNNLLIGRAIAKGEQIGGVLFLCHGQGATYQIGWNAQAGRDLGAHYLLLWDALHVLKSKNIKTLDFGGVNDEGAKGVKKFKEGMGGYLISLPGIYH